MLTMDRRPFLGNHASSHPQPETEKMAGQRMQLQGAVSLMAMQKYRDAGYGYMGENQGNYNITPPR